MKSESPEQSIFAEALRCETPEALQAYLAVACGSDLKLHLRIMALLEATKDAGDFLEEPPAAFNPSEARIGEFTESVGDRIGRYKLLEEIGEGGCGTVYMAEQEEPVRRRVALKVIKLGMDTRQVVARFEAERQALALMDHPNIARVLDGGATQAGRPYFVMELVRGVRITTYCDEAQLTIQARLHLFIQVCQAVQHAHQKGIIHRDIKPSNILVTVNDGAPVVKVIDFGIAKATGQRLTDKTLFTQFHSFIGTPAYISPEQAEMSSVDIDTRSDIYSLGVLLYELLAGRTPFDGDALLRSGLDQMRRTLREEEPPTPSALLTRELGRRIQPSLGNGLASSSSGGRGVVQPPLSDDSGRALCSVNEARALISAVRGDLDWIVMKCLEKDRGRRYPTANALSADIQRHIDNVPITARPPDYVYRVRKWIVRNKLAFGTGMIVIAALLIGFVVSASQYVEKSRAYERVLASEREQSRLREAAEAEVFRSEKLAQFLTDMLRGVGPSVAQGRDTVLLREILDKTVERVAHDLDAQPEVLGDLYFTLGRTYSDLTAYLQAEEMFTLALERYRRVLAVPHRKLVLAEGQLAVAQVKQRKSTEGKPHAEAALQMARALGNPSTLVTALRHQARALDPGQDIPEAVPYLREALTLQRQLGNDSVIEADILRQLGGALAWKSDLTESESVLRDALNIHVRHLPSNDIGIAGDWFNLAQVLTKQNRFSEAETSIRNALDIIRPQVEAEHQSMMDYTAYLTHVLILSEKWNEAEILLKETVDRSPKSARYRNLMGTLYARQSRWAEAAVEFQIEASIPRHANYVPLDPVVAMLKAGMTNECIELWQIFHSRLASTREFDVADKLAKMGLLLPLGEGDLASARKLADYASTAKEPEWLVPWMQFVKALADLRGGSFDSAVDWSARCLQNSASIPPNKAGAHFIQAMALAELNRRVEAQKAFQTGESVLASASEFKTGNLEGYWVVWTISELLQTEADRLITSIAKDENALPDER